MLCVAEPTASRRERYRDLLCDTAELVSAELPVTELVERAGELAKAFFGGFSLDVRLRDAELSESDNTIRVGNSDSERATLEVLRTGLPVRTPHGTAMHVPLRSGGEARGVVSLVASAGATFDDLDASLFKKWASLLAVRLHELQLSAANSRLKDLAGIDALTGIYNRRTFSEIVAAAWHRAAATQSSLAIAMIDVDFFKLYNDRYGHVAGDACLKQVASTIALSLRSGDVCGRYGGEEFAVLFEAASLDVAIEVAERLRENVSALDLPHVGSRLGCVTASVGVAAAIPISGEESSALFKRADAALYSAKERGRNRVVAEAYVSDSAAALPHHEVRGNLPIPLSSFCGRQDDALRIRAALADARLTTITGFGGVGKTRLAVEVAHDVAAGYRDGAWFIDLAGTRDPNLIAGVIASALALADPAAAESAAALGERCRDRSMLLVLDNCEHLKKDCASFATALLRAAPRIRILATSREPLGAPDELILPLAPFCLPEDADLPASEALRLPAVKLFINRARTVTVFEPDDKNVATLIDLCRRVDGLPLGIEMAAARLKTLSLEQLRDRLDRRFTVLTRRDSGAVPHRQQTLRSVIDWSYDLLSAAERRLFRYLGIFAGSFTLDAVSAIYAVGDPIHDTLDSLEALVDKSLLIVEPRREGVRTFRYFESIRSYARDRLFSEDEVASVERRYRDYYLGVAAAAATVKGTSRWLEALQPLEYAADDLRAVLERSVADGRDLAFGAELATNLVDYWKWIGLPHEGRSWLECALRRGDDAQLPDKVRARVRLALFTFILEDDTAGGEQLASEAVNLLQSCGDGELLRSAWFYTATVHFFKGEFDSARAWLEKIRAEGQVGVDPRDLALFYSSSGLIHFATGSPENAIGDLERSEALFREVNRESSRAACLGNLAESISALGRFSEAITLTKRALAIAQPNRDPTVSWLLGNLSSYYLAIRDWASAVSFAREGLRASVRLGYVWAEIYCCDTFARIAFARGDVDIAACVLGYADRRIGELNLRRQPVDQKRIVELSEGLHEVFGLDEAERRLAEGGRKSREMVLALVDGCTFEHIAVPAHAL